MHESESAIARRPTDLADAYQEHYSALCRFINRRTRDRDLAADIAHDVFIELIRAWPKLDLSRPVLPWLHVVARRRVLDEIRGRCTRERLVQTELRLMPCTTPAPSLSTLDLIGELSHLDQEVVYRRVFLAQSFSEISMDVNVSAGACRMRYLRAIRSLRESAARD